ncbi:ATP-dependent Clp protease ATP-binding subunit ClpX [Striga asiatica]|uniref:ATP-dependent Clp protease ATP-binding subunit ClpX n=1 Tax=Striga asiatica TaxID=4170 RepID=A0A5A7PKW6_STRAF|nr:ATP-dependent Clp protease ATP-binding subunit ClpX [Striga asiatica]
MALLAKIVWRKGRRRDELRQEIKSKKTLYTTLLSGASIKGEEGPLLRMDQQESPSKVPPFLSWEREYERTLQKSMKNRPKIAIYWFPYKKTRDESGLLTYSASLPMRKL